MSIELPTLVNAFYTKRNERLAADKVASNLKEDENKLKEQIIRLMQEGKLTAIGASLATVKLHEKEKPQATDWALVYDYILKTGSFDLLHKRLTQEAVELRWIEGEQIPGITKYPVYDLSISK